MKKQKVSLALRKQKISSLAEKNVKAGDATINTIRTIRVTECQILTNFTQCGQWTCEPNTFLTDGTLCCLITKVYC